MWQTLLNAKAEDSYETTEETVTAWEVVRFPRSEHLSRVLNEQQFTRKGRRKQQEEETAYTWQTYWHEITRQGQITASSSVGLNHREKCFMDLLSTPASRELHSLYGSELDLAPRRNVSKVWEAELNQLPFLSDLFPGRG